MCTISTTQEGVGHIVIERLIAMSKMLVGLQYEDRLEGLSNYSPWKKMIKLVLMVNMIWDFAKKEIKKLTDPKELELYEEMGTKAKLIILDDVKDPLIYHLSGKRLPMRCGNHFKICSRIRTRFDNWYCRIS